MPKKDIAAETINAVLACASERSIAERDGDIIQYPVSILHAYEYGKSGECSDVAPGYMVADRTLANAVQSAWEGTEGALDKAEVIRYFVKALETLAEDIKFIADVARDVEAPLRLSPSGRPACPYCRKVMQTLSATQLTVEDVEVTLSKESVTTLKQGEPSFEYYADDDPSAGFFEFTELTCPHCGRELPPAYSKIITVYTE